jgi:hypothetical protein
MTTRKITIEDLQEPKFQELVRRAEEGYCVVPGCNNLSELIHYLPGDPPILCYTHQDDGTLTHYGEYQQTKNPYYQIYTCCDSAWKLCKCSQLCNKFAGMTSIPVTDRQRQNMADRLEFYKRQQEEQERYERMMNAGHDEYYDR